MAIQNFLSGGYYGKLGNTVGQRWHNKRTIRAYVIPANPRTEKQQANRQLFAHATKLAQIAFRTNKGDPRWDTSEKGQFSQLVQTALRRLKAGMSDADAIPLYPDGYTPSIVLGNVSPNWSAWPASVTITADSNIMAEDRTFEVLVSCQDVQSGNAVILTYEHTVAAGSVWSFTFNQDLQYSLPAGSSISAVTIDDVQHGGASISLPVYQLVQPSAPWANITLDTATVAWVNWPVNVTITATSHVIAHTRRFKISVYCQDEYMGSWVTIIDEVEIQAGSYLSYTFNQALLYSLPSGAYISAVTIDDEQCGGSSIALTITQLVQPSYPYINITLGNAEDNWDDWPDSVTITAHSHAMTHNRRFYVIIHCRDEYNGIEETLTYEQVVTAGSYFSYTFNQELRYSLPEGSSISAYTIDDAQCGGSSIILHTIQLEQPALPLLNITITWLNHNYNTNTGTMIIYGTTSIINNPVYAEVNCEIWEMHDSQWETWTWDTNWSAPNTAYLQFNMGPGYELRQGCYIHAGSQERESDDFYYIITWDKYDFSW